MDNNFVLLFSAMLTLLIAVLLFVVLRQSVREAERSKKELSDLEREMKDCYHRLSEENRAIWEKTCALISRDEFFARSESDSVRIVESLQGQVALLSSRMDELSSRMDSLTLGQDRRLGHVVSTLDEKLTQNDKRLNEMRETLFASVTRLQEENSRKLEDMRKTVDEKLHATLDRRLGESFSLVNQRLEEVYKGLGEMRTLAGGVGDLKKVLTNVRTRGVWGEVQLGSILSEMLSPTQYETNCAVVPGSDLRVEYAIRLPGSDDRAVLLPIDAKFPLEDYRRLADAIDAGTPEECAECANALKNALRVEAKRISSKYIKPPFTTDFAVMFLPLEGLYVEALKDSTLYDEMQDKYRIVISGPSTLSALITSLQIGFRSVAIEKRSMEVWQLLNAVRNEFGRFSELLDSARKRIRSAGESLEMASKHSRGIQQRLRNAETLEVDDGNILSLPLSEPSEKDDSEKNDGI
ncbi:MAG: DNA recombination protein RmuC [Clostridia bacterium]|nr:DNA recombination protein RmuC [Clostridia bacterium]